MKRLGARLRHAGLFPERVDIELLSDFRAQHLSTLKVGLEVVLGQLGRGKGIACSGRLKNTQTIIDKLKRGTALSTMQDIAGIRLVLPQGGVTEQDALVQGLCSAGVLNDARVHDHRPQGQHGYRAVHVIGMIEDYYLEIQVRTELQHMWAQTNERLADVWGRGIRYGQRPDAPAQKLRLGGAYISRTEVLGYMDELSQHIAEAERAEASLAGKEAHLAGDADDHYAARVDRELHTINEGRRSVLFDARDAMHALAEVLIATTSQMPMRFLSRAPAQAGLFFMLVTYDRSRGLTTSSETAGLDSLMAKWRDLDAQHGSDPNTEIVLLGSNSMGDLVRTHARYFYNAGELASPGTPS